MTGGDERVFEKSDSSFDLQGWKDTLNRAHGGPRANKEAISTYYDEYLPYIQDGTFQGIILLDDLAGFPKYPSRAQIEGMAAYAKKLFPALPTVVRERATELKSRFGSTPFTKLDAAWAQYRSDRGTPASYRDANIAAAKVLKLGLVLGINITDGLRQGGEGIYVPPADLEAWGNELLKPGANFSDYVCGFFMWKATDYPHLNHPAMSRLATKARTHVAAPCKRR